MRAVLQRVQEASVTVEGKITGQIGPGLMVLFGVGKGDTEKDLEFMVDKIPALRIFEDAAGKMNLSLMDTSKAMLRSVSSPCSQTRRRAGDRASSTRWNRKKPSASTPCSASVAARWGSRFKKASSRRT